MGHQHHVHFESPEQVERAVVEGEAMLGLVDDVVASLPAPAPARILDLGCGPGVAACALAERFPAATVVAADGSAPMLERVAGRAARLGVAGRVTTHPVELPDGIDALPGPFDLVWLSMALHHVGDEVGALERLRPRLRPGGTLVVIERAAAGIRFLDDGGRPGLWDRIDAASSDWFDRMRSELHDHTPSRPYGEVVAAAGYDVVTDGDRTLTLDAGGAFAELQLRGIAERLQDEADPDDLAALATLVNDPAGLGVVATRRVVIAHPR